MINRSIGLEGEIVGMGVGMDWVLVVLGIGEGRGGELLSFHPRGNSRPPSPLPLDIFWCNVSLFKLTFGVTYLW